MVFRRNPHYHGRFGGNVERVALTLLLENAFTRQMELYEAGSVDVCMLSASTVEETDRMRRLHAEEYVSLPYAGTGYVAFDVRRAPFDDPRVRRAFAQAVDREALAGVALGGYYFPASGGLVPPGMPGHVPGVALPYDPGRARELLLEAGYGGDSGFPPVELATSGGQHAHGKYLSEQWRENLGVPLRWREVPWAEYLPMVHRDPPHIFYMGWHADYPDPDGYLRVVVELHTAWRHRRYLELVDQARQATDQEGRMGLYAQAERLLAEEVPILPLTYNRNHMLLKPWVRRYPFSVRRDPYWKDVILEPH
jgi:oligopeptide transport system substrate-binding protein